MSKVQGCTLKRTGDLPFRFLAGGCNTFSFGVMLCFSTDYNKGCHS